MRVKVRRADEGKGTIRTGRVLPAVHSAHFFQQTLKEHWLRRSVTNAQAEQLDYDILGCKLL